MMFASWRRRALLIGACAGALAAAAPAQTAATAPRPAQAVAVPEPAASGPAASPAPRDPALWPRGYFDGDPVPAGVVYLTFDDGPSDFTADILETLHQKSVKATFFINSFDRYLPKGAVGEANYLLRYRSALERMVAEGHALGNHTFSHKDLAGLDRAGIVRELDLTQRHLDQALGKAAPRLRLIRPPWGSPWFGNFNTAAQRRRVCAALAGRGLVMNWTNRLNSLDSNEWADGEWWNASDRRYHPGGPAYKAKTAKMLAHLLAAVDAGGGGVVLLHDIHPTSRDMLAGLVDGLRAKGYRFATLDEYAAWRWPGAAY